MVRVIQRLRIAAVASAISVVAGCASGGAPVDPSPQFMTPPRPVTTSVTTTAESLATPGAARPGRPAETLGPRSAGSDDSRATMELSATSSSPMAPLPVDPDVADVWAVLDRLPVKGRAPKTGYERAAFGPAWSDAVAVEAGRNGCDTRNDILRRDLADPATSAVSRGCLVLAGVLHDDYTGATIDFTRGQATSAAVQIDHLVALSDAWQKGAQRLDAAARQDFANDPLNLQAVDGPTNAAKGDGDAATWLPPHKRYRCTYVARQVLVKDRYGLWVTRAEYDAIARVLGRCTAPIELPGPVPALDGGTVPPPVDCYPLSNKGHCYEVGQMCATRYRGDRGLDAAGRTMACLDVNGSWRWVAG